MDIGLLIKDLQFLDPDGEVLSIGLESLIDLALYDSNQLSNKGIDIIIGEDDIDKEDGKDYQLIFSYNNKFYALDYHYSSWDDDSYGQELYEVTPEVHQVVSYKTIYNRVNV